eukprot:6193420-Pyramimonas_sp.AAC.1
MGRIGRGARQARPGEASTASFFQSSFCSAVMMDISDAPSTVRRLKADAVLGARIVPAPPGEAWLANVSDGSFDTDEETGAC